jgi:predicted RNA binding protein YcfA (HicA-like mRNA interferase family)
MKSISGKVFCKIVEKEGWILKRVTGSHYIYSKQGIRAILSIPVHGIEIYLQVLSKVF